MSDKKTTIDELKKLVRGFVDERDWAQYHNPKDLALAMSIEVGELLEHFRYKDPEKIAEKLRTDQEYKREVGYELADVFYHVLVIADHLGIDLSTTFKEKLAVTAKKYPVHLVKGRNEKHTFYKK